jgi:hypothetical protein
VERRVLRGVFGHKRDEEMGDWRNILGEINKRRTLKHVAHGRGQKCLEILVQEAKRK